MDWNTIITGLISAVTAAGGVGGLAHLRESKRAKRLENDRTVAQEWKELYERSETKVESQSAKIEGLFKKIQELREQCQNEISRAHEIELSVKDLERVISEERWHRCEVNGCKNRMPPRERKIEKNEK